MLLEFSIRRENVRLVKECLPIQSSFKHLHINDWIFFNLEEFFVLRFFFLFLNGEGVIDGRRGGIVLNDGRAGQARPSLE
jgi:hypothetical protein